MMDKRKTPEISDQLRRLSVSANDWFELAGITHQLTNAVGHGERGKVYAELAKVHGIAATHIRRALAAYHFLQNELIDSDQLLAQQLRRASYQAVEQIARWHQREPRLARRAAYRYLNGELSRRKLAELQKAGDPGEESMLDRLREKRHDLFWNRAWQVALKHIGLSARPLEVKPPEFGITSSVGAWIEDRDSHAIWAAIFVEAHRISSRASIERERAISDILRCSVLGYRCLIVVTRETSLERYHDDLQIFKIPDGMVEFVVINADIDVDAIELTDD